MELEALIRPVVFLGRFALPAGIEAWATNRVLVTADALALRLVALVIPLLALGAALDAEARGRGLSTSSEGRVGRRSFFPSWASTSRSGRGMS